MKNTFKLLSILGTAFLATIVMVLPTSCSDDDYPNNNPLVEQVSGMWWTLINQEGIYTLEGKSTPYTRVAHAFLNEDGTGYALSSFFNDEDFTFDNWRDQEAIYIYDGVGKDVTDAKGRTGYTLVNLPWYKGDVQTNLPEGFCDDITPGNGWEWVLNRCGSRNILNNNFFAVYNKYTGILRFFYYLPYGFNAGNDHVWQVSMTDHLAQQSVWRYGLPEDKTIVDKATHGQTGEGTYMTYTTPWTNYMSDDGLVTPNAGWWAFDVNLSQTRLDEVQPNDNIRLQMRSWNTQHVSLSSTMQAAIEGSFAGNLNADVNLLQSQHIGNSASGMIFKLGGMAGNIATVIAKVMEKKYGEAFGPAITFAKAGANLAGIKTEGSHDIDGSIKGKVEGTITLGLSGNIDTEGTIRGSAPTVGIASPTFYLKDFNLKDSHLGQGAWNLKTPPVVYAIKGFSFSGLFGNYVPYFYDPNSIEIQLNPDVFPGSEIESIKVESVCTARSSLWEDDATRLAYDVGSFHLHTIIDFEAIPDARHDDRADVLMTRNGYEKTAYSDYLYAAEDDMGFTMSRQEWEKYSPNNVYWYGRAKDGLWLEPRILIDYKWVRLPYLEVNVVVLVQLKGKDAPVLLSRTYLPAMKKYDAEEFKASVQKAKNYENMKQYDYQMQRIKDYMTLFKLEYPVK